MANLTIDIGNGFYQSDSLPFSNQRCVNLYPNFPQAKALKSSSLFEVQGLREIAKTGDKAVDRNRGGWLFNKKPYFVNGTGLYELEQIINFDRSVDYRVNLIGEIEGSGFCSFSDNGRQLIIINNLGDGYIYDPSLAPRFRKITDAGFTANGTPQQVTFIDSYFVVTTDQNKAIVSGVVDGLNWNALDFFTAEADPDGVVAPFTFKNQLYLLGSETTEAYRNIGGAGVPFQRLNSFVLTRGCSAPFTVRTIGDAVFWIGKGDNEQVAVYQFAGSEPVRVSTTAIDNILSNLTLLEVQQAFSWAYSSRGHDFIAFTVGDFTFVYDIATQKWHERQSSVRDRRNSRLNTRCRIRSVLNAFNLLVVGDSEDGRIGVIDPEIHTEYEQPLITYFTTNPLYDLGNAYTLPLIELVCEGGVGNKDVPDPEVRLEISRDGVVFEDAKTRKLGRRGARGRRQIWRRNGRFSTVSVLKFTVSDAVKRRFFGVELKYKQGINR
jgi:hypothetical protein